MSGNLWVTTCNFSIYIRCRIYITIQYDSDALTNVLLSQLSPTAWTVCVHRHAYSRFTKLVIFIFCTNNNVTFQWCTSVTFGWTDSIKFESLTLRIIFISRNSPFQTEIFRKFWLDFFHRKISVDISCILVISISYNRALSAGINLQNSQQRMFFLDLCKIDRLCFVFTFQCCSKTIGSAGSLCHNRSGSAVNGYTVSRCFIS